MMRYFILILSLFFFAMPSFASLDDNLDYDFINNAFQGQKPVTNQEFENVMKQYEKPKEGFFTKVYKFFDKDKVKYDEAFKTRYESPDNQPLRIKDIPEEKPTVLISTNAVDSFGNIVAAGYYQVLFKEEEGKYYIELLQGANNKIAKLKAKKIDEDECAETIVYGRAQALDNGYIKVIYSNLDLTLLGFLKVKGADYSDFEPLY